MAGISNHGQNKRQPYVTAGDRAYLIGTQDGDFPDMGQHVPGEMGGLWLHPIKLIDGFWASVTDLSTGRHIALAASSELVTYPYGTRFRYGAVSNGLEIQRFQFSPDGCQGLVVRYTFTNTSDRAKRLELDFSVKTDLRPVWFSDHVGIRDARDSVAWNARDELFIASDTRNDWYSVWGAVHAADARPVSDPRPIHTSGNGATAASRYRLTLDANSASTLTFVIAGSATSEEDAISSYRYVAANHAMLLQRKKDHYASIIDRARIRIPDQRLQEVYNWVKINAEWLVRDVPGIGRGLGGGFMEYPWWFGTETYSLQALMATGDYYLPEQTLRLLRDQSQKANGNGRIIHELSTNGAVSNRGNTQETAQFILTVGELYEWTGDLDFAREMYPEMNAGIHWLLTDMDRNGDLFPEGYGIMEVSGLDAELIDVAVYTQQALEATARIARVLHDIKAAERYQRLASQLEKKINARFWIAPESTYADFYGSREQAVSAAEGAARQIGLVGEDKLTPRDKALRRYYRLLARKFSAMPDTSRGWITNENWVITTPMETGIAPPERAVRLLDKIRREDVGKYGPFLSAVDREAMMTISTGVQAVSEANYGRSDQALWYMDRIVQTFNRRSPGTISEMMPDYGCFTIAWTSYGIVIPLIQHIFGIRPDAPQKTVVFAPHMPTGWEDVSIDDLPVGTNTVSFSRRRTARGVEYDIASEDDDWSFVLQVGEPSGARYYLNGRAVSYTASGIRMSGRKNHVLVAR